MGCSWQSSGYLAEEREVMDGMYQVIRRISVYKIGDMPEVASTGVGVGNVEKKVERAPEKMRKHAYCCHCTQRGITHG